jgi:phosphoribosylaminoimidazole carboxylase PurE protein
VWVFFASIRVCLTEWELSDVAKNAARNPYVLQGSPLSGLDSLLSTVQMPGGIPVATFGIGPSGAKNAGLFAAAIIARKDPALRKRLQEYRAQESARVPERP